MIPAIVQVDEVAFDDYSQVLENTQRDNLSPMDIARFIQKRKALGESNSQIARNLSEKPEWVTYHLALIDLPPEIKQAFDAGQIKGAKATYELRKLYGKSPESVQQLIESGDEITQVRIREMVNPVTSIVITAVEPTEKPVTVASKPERVETPQPTEPTRPETTYPNPAKLASPCVIGIYQGKPVQVLIQLKPSQSGYAWIHHSGIEGHQEVLADQITLSRIEEKHP